MVKVPRSPWGSASKTDRIAFYRSFSSGVPQDAARSGMINDQQSLLSHMQALADVPQDMQVDDSRASMTGRRLTTTRNVTPPTGGCGCDPGLVYCITHHHIIKLGQVGDSETPFLI